MKFRTGTTSAVPLAIAAALVFVAPAAAERILIASPITSAWPDLHFAWDPFGGSRAVGDVNLTSVTLPFGAVATEYGNVDAEKLDDADYQFVRTQGASVNAAWLPAGTPIDASQAYIDIGLGYFCELEPSAGSCGLPPPLGSTFYVGYRVTNPPGHPAGTYYGWAEFVRSPSNPSAVTLSRRLYDDAPGTGVVAGVPEPDAPAAGFSAAVVALALAARRARRRQRG